MPDSFKIIFNKQKEFNLSILHIACVITFFSLLVACNSATSKKNRSEKVSGITEKPNVIFILVDDMAWNGLSCYGNPYISTPHIDELAENGMMFTEAYVAPECLPTRAEFLSGQYGARTGLTQVHTNRVYPYAPLLTPEPLSELPEDNYTIANMFQDAGYITAISGKWGIGNTSAEAKRTKYGFDFVGKAEEKPWDQVDKDKATPEQTNETLEFIRENKNHPFFVYLSYFNIHTPLQAPDSLVRKFVNMGYQESTNRFGNVKERPTAQYLAMINYLDDEIGRLIDGLDEMNLLGKTLIVFNSDNGALNRAWDNSPLRGAKGVLYEGGIRVPLIMHWPDIIQGGTKNGEPVHIVDMYATFKDLAMGNISQDKVLDGESLVPLMTQSGKLKRKSIFWHHPHYIHDYGKTPSSAIRQGDYKLIYYYGDYLDTREYVPVENEPYGKLILGERIELFNLAKDPGEGRDLSKEEPEVASKLLSELKMWLASIDASLPVKNESPDYEVWYKSKNRN